MWSWTIKKAEHQRIDAFELWCWRRLLRVLWTARRSNQSILNQPWIFIGRTDAEVPILRPPDAKSQLPGKHLEAGKDWRQKEKQAAENEMVRWHHSFNGYEFEQTPGDNGGQEPGVLQSMGSQRARHDSANEQQQSQNIVYSHIFWAYKYNHTLCILVWLASLS